MEIRLSRRSDYALRAALHLARHAATGRVKSREMAEAMDIPPRYLNHVLAALVRAGVATSIAGPSGGYRLAREPATVSMLDLVEAVDGDIRATVCPLRGGPCRWDDACALHERWARAQQALLDELANIELDDLARRDAALEAAGAANARAAAPADARGASHGLRSGEPR